LVFLFVLQNGAEDLRVKMEMRPMQSPIAPSIPPTPTTPIGNFVSGPVKGGLPGGLDMLTILGAAREIGNMSDGKSILFSRISDPKWFRGSIFAKPPSHFQI
jgi:hypothetical protein